MSAETVFLFDVDNTLIDNDQVTADLRDHLDREVGAQVAKSYWQYLEHLRSELGYVDYLGALQRFRDERPHELSIFTVSRFLIEYPFTQRLYAGALEAVAHANTRGTAVIFSDGDAVFQPHKVYRSGLTNAVNGRVLIYAHKQAELADVETRFPAEHYLFMDDKMHLLAKVKEIWKARVTTVFVKQGHYAQQPNLIEKYGKPDVTLASIAELPTLTGF